MSSEKIMYDISNVFDFTKKDDLEYINNLGVKVNSYNGLTIVQYNKNKITNDNISTLGLLRSVIYNSKGDIVSYSSPKSYRGEPQHLEDCVVEEFVEGTMFHIFYANDEWNISTRSIIGAKNKYFDVIKNDFRTLFLETMNEIDLEFEDLDKNISYNFVMQHPGSRIVVPISKHKLYLTSSYKCEGTKIYEYNFTPSNSIWKKVSKPEIFSYSKVPYLFNQLQKEETKWYIQGYMIHDTDGKRYKVRNGKYEEVKLLRGNNPKLQFQYYNLRQNGQVTDYLKYYPEHKQFFQKYRDDIHRYTNNLLTNYIKCFIKKERTHTEFPYQYRNHMWFLHKKYLDELRELGLYVNKKVVMTYVNTLEPARLMFTINHPLKTAAIEEKQEQFTQVHT